MRGILPSFSAEKALIEDLSDRLSKPGCPLMIVLGASGSGKSSLVKAGLIPSLRESQKKGQQLEKWYILDPMRPGKSPFTELARTILSIANPSLVQQLDQMKTLDQVFEQTETKQSGDRSNQEGQSGSDARTTDAAFTKIADAWNSATPGAKLLLIVDYFKQLEILYSFEALANLRDAIQATVDQLANDLRTDLHGLTEVIATWSQTNPKTKLLLVIDQFEELITMAQEHQDSNPSPQREQESEQKEWQQFLLMLRIALASHRHCLRVILTLRSDFEPRFLDSALKSHWRRGRFPVRAMNSDELRQAIEGPALKQALYFNPENLVSKLIDEVGQMPGALPLLSFALSELYIKLYQRWTKGKNRDESTERALKLEDYTALGGVAGSLTRRATEEYDQIGKDENLGEACQRTMQRVMLRMVTIEGGGVARRRVLETELVYSSAEENQRREKIINQLVNVRLLVKGQETEKIYVEPAHDFLLRWNNLQEWIDQEQEDLALQQRLTPAAVDWHKNDRNTNLLWIRDPRLALLENIKDVDRDNWLNQLELEFVQNSVRERQNELEATQKRLKLSLARQLAAQSELVRDDSVESLTQSALLATQSLRYHNTPQGQRAFQRSILALPFNPLFSSKLAHCNKVTNITFSPDSQYLAATTNLGYSSEKNIDSTLQVWHIPSAAKLENSRRSSRSYAVTFSSDSQYLAVAEHNQICIIEVTTGRAVNNLFKGYRYIPNKISFSSDNKYLSLATGNDHLSVWAVENWQLIFEATTLQENGNSSLNSIVYSFDFRYIATSKISDSTSFIEIWERDVTGIFKLICSSEKKHEPQASILLPTAISPDGQYLIMGSSYLVEIFDKRVVKSLSDRAIVSEFNLDGSLLAVIYSNTWIEILEVFSGRVIVSMQYAKKPAISLQKDAVSMTFSMDSKYLVVATNYVDSINAKVYEVGTGQEVVHIPEAFDVAKNVAYSPNGHYLATANSGTNTSVSVWFSWWREDPVTAACKYLLPRNLTEEEWHQHLGDEPYQQTCPNLTDKLTQLDALNVLSKGKILVEQGKTYEAITAYDEAQKLDSEIKLSTYDWNKLCWFGTLHGHASEVMYACDIAVKLGSEGSTSYGYRLDHLAFLRDSRGIARACLNDFLGAIDDFEFYIERQEMKDYKDQESIQQRHLWIESLKNNENPFTLEEIRKLSNN